MNYKNYAFSAKTVFWSLVALLGLIILTLILPTSVGAQTTELAGKPTTETAEITTETINNVINYFYDVERTWNDEDGNIINSILEHNFIGYDTASVEGYLVSVIEKDLKLENRIFQRAFEENGLNIAAEALEDFNTEAFWERDARLNSGDWIGDYKVWIADVAYDAVIQTKPNGNLEIDIATVDVFPIRTFGEFQFEIRNYFDDGEHTIFQKGKENAFGKWIFYPPDFDKDYKIKKL